MGIRGSAQNCKIITLRTTCPKRTSGAIFILIGSCAVALGRRTRQACAM